MAAVFLVAMTLSAAFGATALADPETASASPSTPSAAATASAGGTESPSPIDDILIKLGDEGDNVILLQLRLRDLGYYNYKITGFFGDFTKEALSQFQQTNGIDADGIAGQKTLDLLYSNDAKRMPVQPMVVKPKPVTVKKPTKYGQIMEWADANRKWKIGMKCKVVDFDTGISYTMVRVNRSYTVGHADVAPATKADTRALKKTFDGVLTAYRRALLVNLGGKWIAASIYAEPHGSTGVPGNGLNKADGTLLQECIHFKNSWTTGRGLIDSAHQYQIKRAANMKPGARSGLVYPGD